ncbi:MAG: co-chaperone GroES [Minisyncoccota bacterium]
MKKPVQKSNTSKLSFRPAGDRVLVKPESVEEKTASGIIIPDTARKEKPEKGVVVAVGGGKRGDDNEIIPVAFKVGDTVMFGGYGNDEIEIDGEDYLIVQENNILGTF